MAIKIDDDILQVLERTTIAGNGLRIEEKLDPKKYQRVAKVLEAMGGKWNRKEQATLFEGDAREIVDQLLDSGEYSRAKQDLGQFFTPKAVVDQVIALAGPLALKDVLEPSAGDGAIVGAALDQDAYVTAIEIDPKVYGKLFDAYGEQLSADSRCADFLAYQPVLGIRPFDVVLMNPPFAKQADIDHVLHAAKFLKSGGRLVAIMSAGVTFRENRKTADFRAWVEAHGGTIEPLPDNAFAESGTAVRTCIVTLEV